MVGIPLSKKILFVLLSVGIIILGILAGSSRLIESIYQNEKALIIREANVSVDALEQHTVQIVNQVDLILNSVRIFYYRTRSIAETEMFINSLNFDKSVIDNIYLISKDGAIIISHDESAKSRNVSDRDYYRYHRSTIADNLFVSSVESGRVTGQYHFRITRRINNADGSFGGIALATVNPKSFTQFYRELKIGQQNVASLIGVDDRKLRARIPEPNADMWDVPIESQIWSVLNQSESGSYETQSVVDNIQRIYMYKKVGMLPLVMVVGFSDADVKNRVAERKKWIIIGGITVIGFISIIAGVMLVVFVNRDKLAIANQKLNVMNAQLKELALYDSLTGLPSRILFSDRLRHELLTADRNKAQCFLLYLDLDGFKAVNDNFGHDAGDELLKSVSGRMLNIVRSTDTICRWGGDEFLILLPESGGSTNVIEVAERLIAIIKEPVEFDGSAFSVSCSIGIACYPDNAMTPDELLKAADSAMYHAKKQGKGQVLLSAPE